METIIVTGIGGNVGQGVLRNIRDSFPDINIIGLDIATFTPGNYLCNKTYKVPYAYDPNYLTIIQQIVETEKVDLIIPTTDYEIYYISLSQQKINCKVSVSNPDIAKIYLDKYETYKHHSSNNIPFATTWSIHEYNNQVSSIIAKPREGRGSRGVLKNPNNLEGLSDDYIIQPLVEGVEITTAVYVTQQNTIHGIFTMERELTNGTTSKSKVTTIYDEELLKIVEKMVAFNKLRGSFNIQSIVTNDGDIIPFEINCRISGTNSIRHQLGFQDVKYTIQEYLYNEVPEKPNPIKGIATRILLDIIYPDATNEEKLNNLSSKHIIY